MTHVTCRLTAKNRDQLRNPTLGNRVRATFTFYLLQRNDFRYVTDKTFMVILLTLYSIILYKMQQCNASANDKLLETMTHNTYSVFLQYCARITSNYKLLSIILVSDNILHTIVPMYDLHFSRNNGNITGLQIYKIIPLVCYQYGRHCCQNRQRHILSPPLGHTLRYFALQT